MQEKKRVLVIGAGASGLMAAGVAAARGREVIVLERMPQAGRKLRISGKGRCNITNDTDVEGLLRNIPTNGKFLKSAFYAFGPQKVKEFFAKYGVETKTERGGRVFPLSDDADDVVNALLAHCAGAQIRTGAHVQRLREEGGKITGAELADGSFLPADAVILATGGASYPGTGSRGEGFRIADALGHTISPILPSLIPLETEESWPAEAQGLSLRNVTLTAYSPQGKRLHHELGEMIFTHFGVSGPLVLTASRFVADQPGSKLVIDLKPGLDEQALDARIQRDLTQFSRRQFANALGELLPRTLIPIIIALSGIPEETPVHQITRQQRLALTHLLKHLTLTVKRPRPLAEAIITRGGVSTKEIDPRTMASKLISGLYFTGEIIDTDAFTGGFNLQIAWSTGYLAGMNV